MRPLRATALTLCALLGSTACGDDGGATIDAAATIDGAPTIDAVPRLDAIACTTDLAPTDDATGITVDLLISEIDPGGFIELYNNTDQPIALANVSHQLCSPFDYRSLATLGPDVIIGPGGFATLPWPAGFDDVDAGGEVILYTDLAFTFDDHIVDFICWGTNPHGSRLTQADNVNKWTGDCAAAITGGSIHRVMSTDGTTAASYDVAGAPSPTDCE